MILLSEPSICNCEFLRTYYLSGNVRSHHFHYYKNIVEIRKSLPYFASKTEQNKQFISNLYYCIQNISTNSSQGKVTMPWQGGVLVEFCWRPLTSLFTMAFENQIQSWSTTFTRYIPGLHLFWLNAIPLLSARVHEKTISPANPKTWTLSPALIDDPIFSIRKLPEMGFGYILTNDWEAFFSWKTSGRFSETLTCPGNV